MVLSDLGTLLGDVGVLFTLSGCLGRVFECQGALPRVSLRPQVLPARPLPSPNEAPKLWSSAGLSHNPDPPRAQVLSIVHWM